MSIGPEGELPCPPGVNDQERTVTIGLAVKCVQKPLAAVGERNSVQREQFLFNRMFQSTPVFHSSNNDNISSGTTLSSDYEHEVFYESGEDDEEEIGERAENLGKDLNILIICSTGGFSSSIFEDDRNVKVLAHDSTFPHISETILLNLSTRERRASFFGIESDEMLMEKVEWIVAKTLQTETW